MNSIERHKRFAIEILAEWAVINQQQDYYYSFIEKIASTLTNDDSTNNQKEFIQDKFNQYDKIHLSNDDSLFINSEFTPQCITEGLLVLFKDKLNVLITILQHLPQHNLQHKFFQSLEKAFDFKGKNIEKLSEFISTDNHISESKEFFCIEPIDSDTNDELEGYWVDSNKPSINESIKITSSKLKSKLLILFLTREKLFLIKEPQKHNNESQTISLIGIDEEYVLDAQHSLSFSEIKSLYNKQYTINSFALIANNFSQKIKNKEILNQINFTAYPGELIAVAGNEGAGKSTLLAVLAGLMKPFSGSVHLNAYDTQQYKYQLSNLIGFVPEDDLLFSNLTAYENVSYAYKLSTNQSALNPNLVDELFEKLGIQDIRNEIVGKTEDKNIFPYQRRLLNIARELVRDPKILIIDNSKSGLSLSDASKVIEAITPFTYEGKIVITSISETNKVSFKNFDKLLVLCNNGRLAYYGNRKDSIEALSSLLPEGIAYKYEKNLTISSDTLIGIIDYLSKSRIKNLQSTNTNKKDKDLLSKKTLPQNSKQVPRLEQQYLTYTLRNFKTKISKQKELSFSFLAAPTISFILSVLMRQGFDGDYSFSENENIPLYFYISILVCVFLGISQSIGEIISDKRLLIREESINLSFFSYINAKTTYLFLIVLIQTFLYTIIGNGVLEIYNMTFYHWAIYFSSGSAGIMLGLFYSSMHSSYNSAILKTLPITMLILLILGGGILPLNIFQGEKKEYTPFISDLTVTRWAYEAIMVKQFTDNKYNEHFFEYDKAISNGAYNLYHILPKLKNLSEKASTGFGNHNDNLQVISSQLKYYIETEEVFPFEYIDTLSEGKNNFTISEELEEYITYLEYYFRSLYNNGIEEKKSAIDSINKLFGNNYYSNLNLKHDNKSVRALTTQSNQRSPYVLFNNKIIPKTDLIFKHNTNNYGRAAFFMHKKQFNGQQIGTFEFNLSVIWVINILVYVLLISNIISHFKSYRT